MKPRLEVWALAHLAKLDLRAVQDFYDNGATTRETANEFKVSREVLAAGRRKGLLKFRTQPESIKLLRSKGLGIHVWTAEERQVRSEEKKKLYAENPEMHPNRKLANNRKRMSFPERLVFDYLMSRGIAFEHNFYIKPFWVDFRIDNRILEIDGQYWHDSERDLERDVDLRSRGFTIKRFSAKAVIKDISAVGSYLGVA